MEPNAARPQNMIETTDALEAVSACQSMKNFLFTLALIAMVLCQLIFWMNHFGLIAKDKCSSCEKAAKAAVPTCPVESQCSAAAKPQANAFSRLSLPVLLAATTDAPQAGAAAAPTGAAEKTQSIEQAIDQIVEAANQPKPDAQVLLEKETDMMPAEIPAEKASPQMLEPADPSPVQVLDADEAIPLETRSLFRISCPFAAGVVAVCNFIILFTAILFSLSLLMCLKISLAGRLGGINHITRAFFISLFLLVVVIPWQVVLPKVLIGSVWLPGELLCGNWAKADTSVFWKVLLYGRFCGLWLVAVWLLLWTQLRSAKWARATVRRLGVVR